MRPPRCRPTGGRAGSPGCNLCESERQSGLSPPYLTQVKVPLKPETVPPSLHPVRTNGGCAHQRAGEVRGVSYLLKEKSRRSNTSTGPVLLRIVRGWPPIRQKAAPATAVPRKLSSTPWKWTDLVIGSRHHNIGAQVSVLPQPHSQFQEIRQRGTPKFMPTTSDKPTYLSTFSGISQKTPESDGICDRGQVNVEHS